MASDDRSNFERAEDDDEMIESTPSGDVVEDDIAGDGPDEEDGSWLDEGAISLLLLAGVALFVFPEPATSALGIVLISIGVVAWLADRAA